MNKTFIESVIEDLPKVRGTLKNLMFDYIAEIEYRNPIRINVHSKTSMITSIVVNIMKEFGYDLIRFEALSDIHVFAQFEKSEVNK